MHKGWIMTAAAAAGVSTILGVFYGFFLQDIAWHHARISTGSQTFQSRFGAMEFAVQGGGPTVIMIHGTGGGFDQGLSMAAPLVAAGYRVIAPSRFGYLQTDFPDDPSSENQADAIIDLMDRLGIERAPVIGVSAGALSAIQVAIRRPDRTAALVTLVPATFVPGRAPPRPNWLGQAIMEYGLRSDFLFWSGITLAQNAMIRTILATDPVLIQQASPGEQARALAVLHDILPVSARSRGLLNDGRLAGTPAEMNLASITAPTLAISVEDDGYKTFEAARHIARSVTNGRLESYPTGGHVFVGHGRDVFRTIEDFLNELPDQ